MGIFDSIFGGRQLCKEDASQMAVSIGLNLFNGTFPLETFMQVSEKFVNELVKDSFPGYSIDSDQSKQIVRLGLKILNENMQYLSDLSQLENYLKNPTEENKPSQKVITPKLYDTEDLSLFID